MHGAWNWQVIADRYTVGPAEASPEEVSVRKSREALASMPLASLLYYVLLGEGREMGSADPA